MSREQYLHERLEWNEQHAAKADFAVAICTLVATFVTFGLLF